MPKRSPSDRQSDNGPASSSDIDIKPGMHNDFGDSDDQSTPSKKQKKSPKKDKVKVEKGDNGKPRQPHRKWSAEEDAIFLEVMEKSCLSALWQEIKADGRLAYRGQPGIRAHCLAFFNKAKKSTNAPRL